jgi:hypothetical protein
MASINRVLGTLVDAALSPFQGLPPIAGLSLVSLAVAVGMLLVMRATSNPRAIADVKRRIHAGIFEVRLFNDDVRALYSTLDILRHNLTYLRLSLAPLPWIILPLILLIAQLQFYYGYDGFTPGQSAIVKVRMAAAAIPATGVAPDIALETPPGLSVQTPLVWIPTEREAAWRIGTDDPGDYQLRVTLDGKVATKRVRVFDRVGRRSPGRFAGGFFNQVIYPAEAPLDSSVPIEAIEVNYPERHVNLFGYPVDWMVLFFGMSLLFAFALRSRFGVVL